jgi:hypothetical protein
MPRIHRGQGPFTDIVRGVWALHAPQCAGLAQPLPTALASPIAGIKCDAALDDCCLDG